MLAAMPKRGGNTRRMLKAAKDIMLGKARNKKRGMIYVCMVDEWDGMVGE